MTAKAAYQLRVELRNVRPPVLRRVLVPADITLARLHAVIQAAMGWTNSHLHSFEIDGVEYGMPDPDGELDHRDDRKVLLAALAQEGTHFVYLYDFGDSWEHDIAVEKVLSNVGLILPCCVDAESACPPEDCGGPSGYGDMLTALADRDHDEHESWTEWVRPNFDAAEPDKDGISKRMRALAARWKPRARARRRGAPVA